MPLNIEIDVKGFDETIKQLDDLGDHIKDTEPFIEWLAEFSFKRAQERIIAGGEPSWPPTEYPSNLHPMLIDTGELLSSLDPQGVQVTYSDGMAEWGTDVPYASFLQSGTVDMSARPYLFWDEDDKRTAEDALIMWLWHGELPNE